MYFLDYLTIVLVLRLIEHVIIKEENKLVAYKFLQDPFLALPSCIIYFIIMVLK